MAYINAISFYLPKGVLTNEEINLAHPEWSVEKISSKTGIYERHIAAADEFSSDMAVKAAEKLFDEHQIDRNLIDYIILCTQSPDYFLPTTACILQEKLNLRKQIGAVDINLGCSGYVYGLGLAKGLIVSGQAKNVVLLTSETYSKFINENDKSNKTIFGDAATATLVSALKKTNGYSGNIGEFVYSTDGSGADALIVKNGGLRYRFQKGEDLFNEEGFLRNDDNLYMDGRAIFDFTATQIPAFIRQVVNNNNFTFDDIDCFVLHQANSYVLQTIQRRAEIPQEKMFKSLSGYGNTVSSTIPIAIYDALSMGKINIGSNVLLCGFGVGLSVAGTVIKF